MEQEAPRQVPYDIDVEQALVGAILVDNYSLERVSSTLKAEHFYDPLHQRLYEAIERMWAKGHAVTPLTLKASMEGPSEPSLSVKTLSGPGSHSPQAMPSGIETQ